MRRVFNLDIVFECPYEIWSADKWYLKLAIRHKGEEVKVIK